MCQHGVPATCISDNGSEFKSYFDELLRLYGVRHITTSAYRPQGNGVVERIHGFLRPALAIAVQGSHDSWDERVPAIAFAYRATEISGTSFTPFMLMTGREPAMPRDLKAEPPARLKTNLSEYASPAYNRSSAMRTA